MIVLDTSVLIYAVGDDHPLRDPCRRILAAHATGQIDAVTSLQAIGEFAYARARRRTRADAVSLAHHVRRALATEESTEEDLDLGLGLFERHPRLDMFDALLAAFAMNRHADALVSADQGFRDVPGLHWIDPASADLDVLVTGALMPPDPTDVVVPEKVEVEASEKEAEAEE